MNIKWSGWHRTQDFFFGSWRSPKHELMLGTGIPIPTSESELAKHKRRLKLKILQEIREKEMDATKAR
jgi:hypothetical protein